MRSKGRSTKRSGGQGGRSHRDAGEGSSSQSSRGTAGEAASRPPRAVIRSPFLACVDAVDDDLLLEVLLPKLVACRAAASVALTCRRLRQLCHGSRSKLHLGPLARIAPWEVEAWTSSLAERFPHCTTAIVTTPTDASCLNIGALAPALARLPRLRQLVLDASQSDAGWPACRPATLALALDALRRQLSALTALTLSLASGRGSEDGRLPWRALAGASQLVELRLTVTASPPGALSMQHVCELHALTRLAHLEVRGDRVVRGDPSCCATNPMAGLGGVHGGDGGAAARCFPGSLQHLTHLVMPAPTCGAGFASLGSCTRLRHLVLGAVEDCPLALDASMCRALGRLTALSHLELGGSLLYTNTPAFHAALSRLTGLRFLGKPRLYAEMLPALAQLTGLETLVGAWRVAKKQQALQLQQQQGGAGAGAGAGADAGAPGGAGSNSSNASSSNSSSVRRLLRTGGCVPFGAFPQLEAATFRKELDATALLAVSACSRLTSLLVSGDDPLPVRSLAGATAAQRRISAVRALAALPALRELDLCAGDNAEVAALLGAGSQLTRLRLWVGHGSSVSSHGLMQLAALRGLQEVKLSLLGLRLSKRAAQALLCGLQHLRLEVRVPFRYQQDMFQDAVRLLTSRRLADRDASTIELIEGGGGGEWDEDPEVASDDDDDSDDDSSDDESGESETDVVETSSEEDG